MLKDLFLQKRCLADWAQTQDIHISTGMALRQFLFLDSVSVVRNALRSLAEEILPIAEKQSHTEITHSPTEKTQSHAEIPFSDTQKVQSHREIKVPDT